MPPKETTGSNPLSKLPSGVREKGAKVAWLEPDVL